ncbi:MAG: hypothetical protein CVU78_07780 [Elusimicrobia bacterium HGW-Elusimicrobia-2]|nr:MAG: hypothetical protein CVU78_07780 [Elusimicrobia bacterium HGW-Elusimicrobia-2]
MEKETLKNIIADQIETAGEKSGREKVISREGMEKCRKYLAHPNILLISGLRRAGKSVFSNLLVRNEKYVFLDFDDERLIEFNTKDFNLLLECFYEISDGFDHILLDEIQNVSGWELFVNRLRKKYKVVVTGSNANLMSGEMATRLTGRFLDFTLFPMSFREFLEFSGIAMKKASIYSTKERSRIITVFEKYLQNGGVFDFYKFGPEFLRNLWRSVIMKDIIVRYSVKYPIVLEELALFLVNCFTSKISPSRICRSLKIKSPHTISAYIKYLEDSFLIFTVKKFSYKLKEQLSAFKKVYVTDNGAVNSLIFKFSENRGKFLENIVAVELKRRSLREGLEIFYWDNYNAECDFVVKKGQAFCFACQVCSHISAINKKREIEGLKAAMKELGIKKGFILTSSTEDSILSDGFRIEIIPVWKWLLKNGREENK